jgi:hypothetical protein
MSSLDDQAHGFQALVEAGIGPEAIPLRGDGQVDERRVVAGDGEVEGICRDSIA